MFDYIRTYYNVPAELGRRVIANGEEGIICSERAGHIGINLDKDKPGVIKYYHPTWNMEYLGLGKIRKITKAQSRYKRYLEYGDSFDSFLEFCYWDSDKDRA